MRRQLFETISDLAQATWSDIEFGPRICITGLEINIPIEVRLSKNKNEAIFIADVPSWRWQCGFTEPFGRLRFRLEAGEGL